MKNNIVSFERYEAVELELTTDTEKYLYELIQFQKEQLLEQGLLIQDQSKTIKEKNQFINWLLSLIWFR